MYKWATGRDYNAETFLDTFITAITIVMVTCTMNVVMLKRHGIIKLLFILFCFI